jgi:DNA-binding transcriptional MerR regulator
MQTLTPQNAIPDKMYFKVGEASALVGVPAYVLRFWETEFSIVRPKRTPSGQRLYRQKDVALLREIKHLLYDRKFTIPGARQRLQRNPGDPGPPKSEANDLAAIRAELQALRNLIRDQTPGEEG